jgi:hypothetical protein
VVEGGPSKILDIGAVLMGSFEDYWGRQDRQVQLGRMIGPASASVVEDMEGAHSIGTAVADHNSSREL